MSNIKHKNSKTIKIFRAGSFLSRAQGVDVAAFFEDSKQSIGSYWESQNSQMVGSGLSVSERTLLLPNVVGVDAKDTTFIAACKTFYNEIATDVPYNGGITLEIGLTQSNKREVSAENMPIELMEYIRYRHALSHPHVALTQEIADSNPLKQYYMFDKVLLAEQKAEKNSVKDNALEVYMEYKDNERKVEMMLVLLGFQMKTFDSANDARDKFKEMCETKPEDVLELHANRDLEDEYIIQDMVDFQVLKKLGTKYTIVETKELVANSLEEMVLFLKDDVKSNEVLALKAALQEKKR
jgi:hypothetical protein